METFWYWLTQVPLDKWPLKQREKERAILKVNLQVQIKHLVGATRLGATVLLLGIFCFKYRATLPKVQCLVIFKALVIGPIV